MKNSSPCINTSNPLTKFYKNLTLLLFFILPAKISNIFINLSIIAVICNIRNINLAAEKFNHNKIQKFLKITVSEEILLLPNYTIHWFWDENFLNTKIMINQQEYTLKEIIKDSNLFFSHMRLVLDMFLNHVPSSLRFKLRLMDLRRRIMIKHNIMSVLIYT